MLDIGMIGGDNRTISRWCSDEYFMVIVPQRLFNTLLLARAHDGVDTENC